jgi:hypothetical protein
MSRAMMRAIPEPRMSNLILLVTLTSLVWFGATIPQD